jgi:hypothetical protein
LGLVALFLHMINPSIRVDVAPVCNYCNVPLTVLFNAQDFPIYGALRDILAVISEVVEFLRNKRV